MSTEYLKRKIFCTNLVLIFSGLFTFSLRAQIFTDTTVMRCIRKGIDYTYNMQFEDADKVFSIVSLKYPDSPVNLLIKGVRTYWENYPMMPNSATAASFEEMLRQCINKCEADKRSELNPEILLTNLSARGMLLLYFTDNGLSRRVISIAPSTYRFLRHSFAFTSVSPDFYFFTGLYNYYREAYPEIHPIYRPIASFFPKGNKALGIRELEISASRSTFLKADSYSFLTWIYTNFEKNFPTAIEFNTRVAELYPSNYTFTITLIKNLFAARRLDEGEKLINSLNDKIKNPFMLAQVQILNGNLREMKYKDLKSARALYEKGISGLSVYGFVGNEFSSIGYFGQSRICESEGDQQGMRKNKRKAEELSGN
ncbi:MAG TPA: hypothetical protein VMT63_04155 [Bacteroidales bacterium]|nr:hypothetical protein [Bacteroidales bacterium]